MTGMSSEEIVLIFAETTCRSREDSRAFLEGEFGSPTFYEARARLTYRVARLKETVSGTLWKVEGDE